MEIKVLKSPLSIAYYDRFNFNYTILICETFPSDLNYRKRERNCLAYLLCLILNILSMQRPNHNTLDSSRKLEFWIIDESEREHGRRVHFSNKIKCHPKEKCIHKWHVTHTMILFRSESYLTTPLFVLSLSS